MKRKKFLLTTAGFILFPLEAEARRVDITISVPNSGTNLSGIVPITITVSPTLNLQGIELYIDNILKSQDTNSPFIYQWDTKSVNDGSHIIRGEAVYKTRRSKAQLAVTVNNSTLLSNQALSAPTAVVN